MAINPLLFWIIYEWAILDKQTFWILGVDSHTVPLTPTSKAKSSIFYWLSSGAFFSAFRRTVSQVQPAGELVPAIWPITQPSRSTRAASGACLLLDVANLFFHTKDISVPTWELGAVPGTQGYQRLIWKCRLYSLESSMLNHSPKQAILKLFLKAEFCYCTIPLSLTIQYSRTVLSCPASLPPHSQALGPRMCRHRGSPLCSHGEPHTRQCQPMRHGFMQISKRHSFL